MKKTMRYLRLSAFVAAGALLASCAKEEEPVANQEIENEDVVVTLTTSVSLSENASRAITGTGEKTFAVGDQIAVFYTNTSSATVKATSQALTSDDISNSGKVARFTVSLTNPSNTNLSVRYVYPASMVDDSGEMTSLASQDGTLEGLKAFDYAEGSGTRTVEDLPAIDLTNQLAVGVFTLKNNTGSANLSGITTVKIFSTEGDYTITSTSAITWPIYVAMKPVANKAVSFKASDATNNYWKLVSGATLAANNFYPISVTMGVPGALPGKFTVGGTSQSPIKVYFSQGNLQHTGNPTYWKFAEDQVVYLGSSNAHSEDAVADRDLFGWGTKAYPNRILTTESSYSWAEWGENAILNGGNTANYGWKTLQGDGWRNLISGLGFTKATIGGEKGVNGLILFPDNWNTGFSFEMPTSTNSNDLRHANYNSYVITTAVWKRMEAFGAVFLPAAGYRTGSNTYDVGSVGYYWAYAEGSNPTPEWLEILSNDLGVANSGIYKSRGCSVRLVRNVQ